MARNRKSSIELTAYDDLFQTDESRAEAALSKIRDIPISEIDEFPDHGLRPRLLYGSLLRGAVKPQAHTARQAAPCTVCTLVLIIQIAEQRKSMIRLFR